MRRVCAVIEKKGVPGRNPLLSPLRERLAERAVELLEWDPTGAVHLPPRAPAADLYLLKADDPAALSAAGSLVDQGAPCLNSYWATDAAHDKVRTHTRLARAGFPVPATWLVSESDTLAGLLAEGPRFVKPTRGAHGKHAGILAKGEAGRAGPGPWLVQEVVGDGSPFVLKVYGVGSRTAVRRVAFVPGVVDLPREPVEGTDPSPSRLAGAAAEICGLFCYGADFVVGRDGLVLVDLNAFPGYRGVPEAPEWIAGAVLAELELADGGPADWSRELAVC
jgi:ribosomal protein S6--L-glutamate ligase